MKNKTLLSILLYTNATAYIAAKIVIILSFIHFIFITSKIHGIIIILAYLAMEILDLQLKYMLKGIVRNNRASTPLSIVKDTIIDQDPPTDTNH